MRRGVYAVVGAFLGAIMGFLIPMVLAGFMVRSGTDPSGAGGASFLGIVTVPYGIVIGRKIGIRIAESLE